jgi:hypothetical protein
MQGQLALGIIAAMVFIHFSWQEQRASMALLQFTSPPSRKKPERRLPITPFPSNGCESGSSAG